MRYDEPNDISVTDWAKRQQALNDARVAEIHKSMGLAVEPAPAVRAGDDGDDRYQASHNLHKSARPVFSDEGEQFADACAAAFAMGAAGPNQLYAAIRTGETWMGRSWRYGERALAPKRERKKPGRAVVDEFGREYPSLLAAAASVNVNPSNVGWLSKSIRRGWRVNGVLFRYADYAREEAAA